MLEKMKLVEAARKAAGLQETQRRAEEERKRVEQEEKEKLFIKAVVESLQPRLLLEEINKEVLGGRGEVNQKGTSKAPDFNLEWDKGRYGDHSIWGNRITITVGECDEINYALSKKDKKIRHFEPSRHYWGIQILGGSWDYAPDHTDFKLEPGWNVDKIMPGIEMALAEAFENSHWSQKLESRL